MHCICLMQIGCTALLISSRTMYLRVGGFIKVLGIYVSIKPPSTKKKVINLFLHISDK